MRVPFRSLGFSALLVASLHGQTYLLDDLHRMLPTDGDFTTDVAHGDIDGDGDVDLVMACDAQPVRVLRNDGTGGFVDDPGTRLPPSLALAVELFDMEGDGDLDLYVATLLQDRLFANDGTGTFVDVTSSSLPSDLGRAQCAASADIDADGDIDVLVANSWTVRQLYLNDGTGRFAEAPTGYLTGLGLSVQDLAFADVDGDSDPDLVVVRDNAVDDLYLNDGAGHFTHVSPTHMPALLETTFGVAPADVDRDGDLDLWLGTEAGIRLLQNDSTGHFSVVPSSQLPAHLPVNYRGLSVGDVDGDGDVDLVFAASGCGAYCDRTIGAWFNDGRGNFLDVTTTNMPPLGRGTDITRLVDLDADGDLDVALGRRGRQNQILRNLGSGIFRTAEVNHLPVTKGTNTLAVGDLDGDGDVDAFLGRSYAEQQGYRSDGHGFFEPLPSGALPSFSGNTLDAALGDLDGDGDLDAIIVDYVSVRLWANRGNAVFDDVTSLSPTLGTMLSRCLSTGDVDGDGDLDVVVGCEGNDYLLRNDGQGVLVRSSLLPGVTHYTSSVDLGDVDGDGDLDIVLGNEGIWRQGEPDVLLINDGRGVFNDVSSTHFPTAPEKTNIVRFGDVDGDGDLDLFTSSPLTYAVNLYRNDGSGHFSDVSSSTLPASGAEARCLLPLDVDGDGDLDLLIGASYLGLRLWANTGSGTFVDVTGIWIPDSMEIASDLEAGDFDRDGDLDVFVANQAGDRVLTNRTRQLAWRTLPRVGRTLTLDAQGGSNDIWFLSVALAPSNLTLPPFGTLYLDPAQLTPLGAGLLNGLGHGSMRFAVPAEPAYVGVRLYWQAAFLAALRLSNLEVSMFEER